MADFKIFGRVVDVFNPRTGTTKDGSPWQMQDIIIEEKDGKYTNKVLFTINGYKISQGECNLISDSLLNGRQITVSCNVSTHKWEKDGDNGYTTNVSVWRVDDGDTRNVSNQRPNNEQPSVVDVSYQTPTQEDNYHEQDNNSGW
ncbi:MAG TPA: hypothetical protein DEQ84_00455 [Prevotellaceae bacterium]|nr:hypothetical protein [Prevotellaceae bacterium]